MLFTETEATRGIEQLLIAVAVVPLLSCTRQFQKGKMESAAWQIKATCP